MGIFDLGQSAANEDVKAETIRRLTLELVEANEKSTQFAQEHKTAQSRVRELEDLLHLQQRLTSDTQSSLALAQSRLDELSSSLSAVTSELENLRLQAQRTPATSSELMYRYENLRSLWEQVHDTLSCPVCYEFIGKGKAISLLCGHTFCEDCWGTWEAKHLAEFKASPQQGRYLGADCPECRESGVRHGKVRIWALEEVIRLVERGSKEASQPYDPAAAVETGPPPTRTPSPPPPRTPSPVRPQEQQQEASSGLPPPTPQRGATPAPDRRHRVGTPSLLVEDPPTATTTTPEVHSRTETPAPSEQVESHSIPAPSTNAEHHLPNEPLLVERSVERVQPEDLVEEMEIDDECASILRPRRSMPYGPIVWR